MSTNVKSLTNVHTITEYRTYYYARVSSTGQNLTRQLEAFHELGAEEREIITDKASGKDIGRPGYQALKTTLLRSGDTLIVTSLDRLSRKKEDIKAELQYFKEHNIRLKILDIPTTLIDPPEGQEWIFDMVLNILIEVMSSIAEQERVTIRERQRQGIEALKHTSAWENYGRPNLKIPENYPEVMRRWTSGEITAVTAMNMTGIKRTTFYRLAAKYKKGELKL
ncbi:recombinase family protein [Blautia obeum]|uniref:recombinase family protein n=1 Tax=Blautia obeum TaxID=40520 RepID=UPI002E8E3DB4|nr:recombinase family protein [Blautia obeum]